MPWTEHERVTAIRRRSHVVDVTVETLDGFRRHLTGRNGAVLTYYGFLTLFPLFLAASTILGFVLESRPEWREELVGSAAEKIPFIGPQLEGTLTGSWLALTIGLAAALWGSMKLFVGLQSAYDDAWEIDVDDRASFVTQRSRALIGLAVIGGAQIATVALATLVNTADLPRFGQALLLAGGAVINMSVAAAMYRFLTSADTTWAMVWPGAVLTGIGFSAIQALGVELTRRLSQSARYGELGNVLGLLAWLSLHAIINLVGAELNAARERIRSDERVDAPPAAADAAAG